MAGGAGYRRARARRRAELRADGRARRRRPRRLPRRPRRRDASPSTCAAATRRRWRSPTTGPPLTYFRAAMVVGAGSESYRTLRYLVKRLPVMIAPSWLRTDTQPIARRRRHRLPAPRAGRPAVRRAARCRSAVPTCSPTARCSTAWPTRWACAAGRRCPSRFSRRGSPPLWLGLVTPVDTNVARPLVEGLRTRDGRHRQRAGRRRSGSSPIPFDEALRRALREEAEAGSHSAAGNRAGHGTRPRPVHLRPPRARQRRR